MDKKLYKELRDKQRHYKKSYEKYSELYSFMRDYKKFFAEDKSIESLKKIEEYMNNLFDDIKNTNVSIRKTEYKLQNNCTHDVLIKWTHSYGYDCFVCEKGFNMDHDKIKSAKLLIDGLEANSYMEKMRVLCDELIATDQDIVDGVIDAVRENKDQKVLIRRR